jgi:hypothetical protein
MEMAGERDTSSIGGALNEAPLADRDKDEPGGDSDLTGGEPGRQGASSGAPGNVPFGGGSGGLAGMDGGGIAAEAAAYGPADGSLADAAAEREPGPERLSGGPTGAEAARARGAGRWARAFRPTAARAAAAVHRVRMAGPDPKARQGRAEAVQARRERARGPRNRPSAPKRRKFFLVYRL